jgi:hypothetical protein
MVSVCIYKPRIEAMNHLSTTAMPTDIVNSTVIPTCNQISIQTTQAWSLPTSTVLTSTDNAQTTAEKVHARIAQLIYHLAMKKEILASQETTGADQEVQEVILSIHRPLAHQQIVITEIKSMAVCPAMVIRASATQISALPASALDKVVALKFRRNNASLHNAKISSDPFIHAVIEALDNAHVMKTSAKNMVKTIMVKNIPAIWTSLVLAEKTGPEVIAYWTFLNRIAMPSTVNAFLDTSVMVPSLKMSAFARKTHVQHMVLNSVKAMVGSAVTTVPTPTLVTLLILLTTTADLVSPKLRQVILQVQVNASLVRMTYLAIATLAVMAIVFGLTTNSRSVWLVMRESEPIFMWMDCQARWLLSVWKTASLTANAATLGSVSNVMLNSNMKIAVESKLLKLIAPSRIEIYAPQNLVWNVMSKKMFASVTKSFATATLLPVSVAKIPAAVISPTAVAKKANVENFLATNVRVVWNVSAVMTPSIRMHALSKVTDLVAFEDCGMETVVVPHCSAQKKVNKTQMMTVTFVT